MSLTGEEMAAPYKKWLENEVSSVPSLRTDLGKFFFGVSTGTVAVFVSLEKAGLKIALDKSLVFSLMIFLVSMFVALLMVRPPVWNLSSNTNIFDEHDAQVTRLTRYVWVWFSLWLVALVPWLYRLLLSQPCTGT